MKRRPEALNEDVRQRAKKQQVLQRRKKVGKMCVDNFMDRWLNEEDAERNGGTNSQAGTICKEAPIGVDVNWFGRRKMRWILN